MIKNLKKEYRELTNRIINNTEFIKTKSDIHHGSTKYNHLLNVSKLSFLLGKIFKANIKTVTIAAVLHDFFSGTSKEKKENGLLAHSTFASKNAKRLFNITDEEALAIETHMYHYALVKKALPFINRNELVLNNNKPASKEAWIVCISDLLVSMVEGIRYEVPYLANVFCLAIILKLFD